jgi:hypothetical protein
MSEALPGEKNRFGRWMEAMNTICGTSYARVARHIGITRGALSQSIYGDGGVSDKHAIAIMEKYHMLAQQQNIPLPITWDKFFLISWFRGDGTVSQADEALRNIEFIATVIRERDELRKRVVETLKRKDDPEHNLTLALEEIERLKGELTRFKGEEGDS